MTDNLLIAALCPHPPIIIPEVGGNQTQKVEKTINALKELADEIVSRQPDTIIVVTPHSTFNPYRFSVFTDKRLNGDFRNFRAPEAKISFDNNIEFVQALQNNIKEKFNTLHPIAAGSILDHGTAVPMYYLAKAGYAGKLVAINYCALDKKAHIEFGQLIKKTMDESESKFAIIASGDLSHRLLPTAPAGYNEEAHKFDELVVKAVEDGNYDLLININQYLREVAGECGYNSLMTIFGTLNAMPANNKVYSYEAPFGVGYLVATL